MRPPQSFASCVLIPIDAEQKGLKSLHLTNQKMLLKNKVKNQNPKRVKQKKILSKKIKWLALEASHLSFNRTMF